MPGASIRALSHFLSREMWKSHQTSSFSQTCRVPAQAPPAREPKKESTERRKFFYRNLQTASISMSSSRKAPKTQQRQRSRSGDRNEPCSTSELTMQSTATTVLTATTPTAPLQINLCSTAPSSSLVKGFFIHHTVAFTDTAIAAPQRGNMTKNVHIIPVGLDEPVTLFQIPFNHLPS